MSSFKCLLPDGRNVDLLSRSGADAFIEATAKAAPGGFNRFSSSVQTIRSLERRLDRPSGAGGQPELQLTAEQMHNLEVSYDTIGILSDFASPEIYAKRIPTSEIECYFRHAIGFLRNMSTNPRWKLTGVLERHRSLVLNVCVSMLKHRVCVNVALSQNFYGMLASFIAAREKPTLPSPEIAGFLCSIVNNTKQVLLLSEPQWKMEKISKKFESCGILLQFLRCSTIPPEGGGGGGGQLHYLIFYDDLLECTSLIRKKLRKGTPCGDAVLDCLEGRDGYSHLPNHTMPQKVRNYMTNIAGLADVFQDGENNVEEETGLTWRICSNCSASERTKEFQQSLMRCSRCHEVYYCSRECQKKDWKRHKKYCKLVQDATSDTSQTPTTMGISHRSDIHRSLQNFLKKNYYLVMKELWLVASETNVTKKDLVLILDMAGGKDGSVAPALRDPPQVIVTSARGCMMGDEPDWFGKGTERYKRNISNFVTSLEDQIDRMTENDLLVLLHHHSGATTVNRTQLKVGSVGCDMLSDKVFDAFGILMEQNDFGPLSEIIPVEMVFNLKKERAREWINTNFVGDDSGGSGGATSDIQKALKILRNPHSSTRPGSLDSLSAALGNRKKIDKRNKNTEGSNQDINQRLKELTKNLPVDLHFRSQMSEQEWTDMKAKAQAQDRNGTVPSGDSPIYVFNESGEGGSGTSTPPLSSDTDTNAGEKPRRSQAQNRNVTMPSNVHDSSSNTGSSDANAGVEPGRSRVGIFGTFLDILHFIYLFLVSVLALILSFMIPRCSEIEIKVAILGIVRNFIGFFLKILARLIAFVIILVCDEQSVKRFFEIRKRTR